MTDNQRAKLLIFDIDGTLADRDTSELLPGVYDWFDNNGDQFEIALATNQGGVGLRNWMEQDGFGEPEKFPDRFQAIDHIHSVIMHLPSKVRGMCVWNLFYSFAYQSKKSGKWAPDPVPMWYGCEDIFSHEWRKPAPGMLLAAMGRARVKPDETIMIGDSDEDKQAAEAAGCHFQNANWFFGREL